MKRINFFALACVMGLLNLKIQAMEEDRAMPELTVENFKKYPEFKSQFIKYATDNFTQIDPKLLIWLLAVSESGSELAQSLVGPAAENFESTNIELLLYIVKSYPQAIKTFAALIIKNPANPETIAKKITIIAYNTVSSKVEQLLIEKLIELMRQDKNNIGILLQSSVLDWVYREIRTSTKERDLQFKQQLRELVCPHIGYFQTIDEFIKATKQRPLNFLCYSEEWKKNTKSTQTRSHFAQNIEPILGYLKKTPEDARSLAITLYKKEKEEQKKGNYVFYHAQTWPLHFYADIYKQLWNIAHHDNIGDDFTFFRFTRPTTITKPRIDSLFMNHALFGNITRKGACSFDYFLKSRSIRVPDLSPADLFKLAGLEKYYQKHATSLENLALLHRQANPKYGNIMLISIPENKLHYVKPAYVTGETRSITIDGKKTSDIKTILDTLIKNPDAIKRADQIEYALPLTTKYALDPYNGPRTYSFNVADKEKMIEYTKNRDEIFTQIKADIEADRLHQLPEKSDIQQIRSKL